MGAWRNQQRKVKLVDAVYWIGNLGVHADHVTDNSLSGTQSNLQRRPTLRDALAGVEVQNTLYTSRSTAYVARPVKCQAGDGGFSDTVTEDVQVDVSAETMEKLEVSLRRDRKRGNDSFKRGIAAPAFETE